MAKDSTKPLSTYVERLPQVRRVLRLYRDRVEIHAAWTMGKTYEQVVNLAELTPDAVRFQVRNKWFKRTILIIALAVATAVVFTRPGYSAGVMRAAMFGYVIAFACIPVALLTYPKRQFVRFKRIDGRPGLDICRSGPDRRRFDDFVAEVQRRIRRA